MEAIERLAEASARVRLSDEVTKEDVDRALSLVRKSMQQVGIDPETGDFDADVVETEVSKTHRDRRKEVLAIIEDRDGPSVQKIADSMAIAEAKVEHAVEDLKERGGIYDTGGGELRVI